MSTQNADGPAQTSQKPGLTAGLTALFALMAILLFYFVVKIWPTSSLSCDEKVMLFGRDYKICLEQRFLLLMILGGALGATIHLVISFTAFIGNRSFVSSWIPWYLLRPLVGAGIALFFYMLLRGGILTYNPATTPAKPDDTTVMTRQTTSLDSLGIVKRVMDALAATDSLKATDTALIRELVAEELDHRRQEKPREEPIPLNPYGMMAIACLVGLFSKEASAKLEEVFKSLFAVRKENQPKYKDKLEEGKEGEQDSAADNTRNEDTVI